MLNFFSKLLFVRKMPKFILVFGENSSESASAIFQILKNFFKVVKITKSPSYKEIQKNQAIIFESSDTAIAKIKTIKYFFEKSSQPILVLSDAKNTSVKKIKKLIASLPSFGYLILNIDDKNLKEIIGSLNVYNLTFGFNEESQLQATDFHSIKNEMTFKLNFKGNTLPIWAPNYSGKQSAYGCLAGLSVAQALNINLVEASQLLQSWR